MTGQMFIFIGIFLITIMSFVTYRIGRSKTNKLTKYIPAMVSVFGIIFFYIKFLFITEGYDVIYDMVAIIFLSIMLVATLLIAIIVEFVNKRNTNS